MITGINYNNSYNTKNQMASPSKQSFGMMLIKSQKTGIDGFCSPQREKSILQLFASRLKDFSHEFSFETLDTHCFHTKNRGILITKPEEEQILETFRVDTFDPKDAVLEIPDEGLPHLEIKNKNDKRRCIIITKDENNASLLEKIQQDLSKKINPDNVLDGFINTGESNDF